MEIALDAAPAWIAAGRRIAYPTETVWGLAADARSGAAIDGLRRFKGRADDAPLSILVTGPEALESLGFRVAPGARRLCETFWPGPLTVVLACEGAFAPGVARGDGAVGVRCSSHPAARGLAARCEAQGAGPVTATSCNPSGAPPARTRGEAARVCAGDEDAALLGGDSDAGAEAPSTVVDLSGDRPRVLRWGALSERALAPLLEELAA